MKLILPTIATFVSISTNVQAAERKFSCAAMDYSISAELTGEGASQVMSVTWPTFAKSFNQDQLYLYPGTVLWPMLPAEVKEWPYGGYIAKDKTEHVTVTVNILRPASMGGGGYSYEGTIAISAKDNDPILVAAYCN
jgi:hypothetical protein